MHRRFTNATEDELERAAALADPLGRWFVRNGRSFPWRRWRSRYRLLVAEVLLQRTRADAVATFLPSFFRRYPGWGAIAAAERGRLTEDLSVLGLQSRRADTLAQLARTPEYSRTTEAAPGVGQYIARAVRVAAEGSSEAMVDANFVRVLRRVFPGPWKADYRYDDRLQELAGAVVSGTVDPRAANWAILDLGALVCAPRRPRCQVCPLEVHCGFARANHAGDDAGPA